MTAPSLKRSINVSLNEDLVREARKLTPDLSGTIELLLHGFVERARA
jgi:post-segregation antitoxin (ccd killing protein)